MKIRYETKTGWPSNLTLCQRVAAYGRIDRVLGFKVGISSQPSKRAALYRYKDPHYKEMVVIYSTTSEATVRRAEKDLINWFKDDYECDNEANGGGPTAEAPYYLYVVLREKLSSSSVA